MSILSLSSALRVSAVFTAAFLLLVGCAHSDVPDQKCLTILHTNDLHSFLAGVTKKGKACTDAEHCTGGWERLKAAVDDERSKNPNVLFLDAGDQWQGTLFFRVGGPELLSKLGREMGWDARTSGNHELGRGCEEACEYFKNSGSPYLAANLKPNAKCALASCPVRRDWIIKEVGGLRVGIIGIANDEVKEISQACSHTEFIDRDKSVRKAIGELKDQGVHFFVVVSHIGYKNDIRLAEQVPEINVIVGGHTHDVLGPVKGSVGDYPTVVEHPNGRKTYVVTAGFSARYLGKLKVCFDGKGEVCSAEGGEQLLEGKIDKSTAMHREIAEAANKMKAWSRQKVTENDIDYPDGPDECRLGECLSGHLLTDAVLASVKNRRVQAALINAGALQKALPKGTVTYSDLLNTLPFDNKAVIRRVSGADILAALDNGTKDFPDKSASLLQTSGLVYQIDRAKPLGQRIVYAKIKNLKGRFEPVVRNKTYLIVTNEYLANGGDGVSLKPLGEVAGEEKDGELDRDILEKYLHAMPTIQKPKDGRILFKN